MTVTGFYCLGGEINNGLEVLRYKLSEFQGLIAVQQLEQQPVFFDTADTFVAQGAWLDPLSRWLFNHLIRQEQYQIGENC
ncbi:MAG: hypothetical protein DRH06_00650 [Deltaproteobacteria bacterium]|nr:MAG: hypothetical protein DRH07_01440 [Deltaproteobacteria bacterium]RLB78833.1 MAG: hypothetical protein DRH06_00650 [Deltaproteobacteria bacterium]